MLAHEVLPGLLADPAGPRVTYYDDRPGPTQGERIELSGAVLANWVAKAGNLLQDELDAGPGSTVALDLPAEHWRTLYWALAAWAVGATVVDVGGAGDGGAEGRGGAGDGASADVLVTTEPRAGHPAQVVVTEAALARSFAGDLPDGAIDEAADLATYGDHLDPYATAGASDQALVTARGAWTYGGVVGDSGAQAPRWLVRGDLTGVLRTALAAWAAGGSVLLSRGTADDALPHRLEVEGATPASATP
ncbi:TIGR03089 family protein [Barrientosiimonas humi]|uniref:TIGR03089 family protein n=1 Tax=Barrientosiimonas humi TaxID=999931 RepID=UPI00370D15A2